MITISKKDLIRLAVSLEAQKVANSPEELNNMVLSLDYRAQSTIAKAVDEDGKVISVIVKIRNYEGHSYFVYC